MNGQKDTVRRIKKMLAKSSKKSTIEHAERLIHIEEIKLCICGHKEKDNLCEVFCDDFIDLIPNVCYLKCFEQDMRKIIYMKLGEKPLVSSFMSIYMQKKNKPVTAAIIPPNEVHPYLHVSYEKVALQEDTTLLCGKCSNCTAMYTYRSEYLTHSALRDCYKCKGNNTVECFGTIRNKYYSHRIGSKETISVGNLIRNESQATEYEMKEPQSYFSSEPVPKVETDVKLVNDVITISIGNHEQSYKTYDQKLKSFVHDFVYSRWQEDTDVSLSTIGVTGPEGKMTPDCIVQGTKCVLELGTCNTDIQKPIEKMYTDKAIKYRGELKQVKAKFFIVIVSPQWVMTNADIDQPMVDELTIRMRLAKPLEEQISRVLGEDIFSSDYSEFERLANLEFSTCKMFKPLDPKYFYELEEINEAGSKIRPDEARDAAQILLSTLKGTETIHQAKKSDVDSYMSKFTAENSRSDLKRVCNIPMILPSYGLREMELEFLEPTPDSVKTPWANALNKTANKEIVFSSVQEIINDEEPSQKHFTKRSMLKKLDFTVDEKAELALSGIGGKAFSENEDVKEHRVHSKLSFHPLVDVSDISDFVAKDLLRITDHSNKFFPYTLESLVEMSKSISTANHDNLSTRVWKKMMSTDFMKFSMMYTNVFIELAYCYKHWTSHYEFMHKKLDCGIEMLIYNPKSTLFVSFAIPRVGCVVLESGKIGPKLYATETHYFTDWSSFDNSQIEHFIKFGPYMGACLADLQNSSSSEPELFSEYARDCVPHLLLLYCNNKTDAEELVTSQRYLFMKLLEDVETSPYVFVDRFPKVIRSRLTSYYLRETISLMNFYEKNKIKKVPVQGEEMILYDYVNIRSLFSKKMISLQMKVNEFYFGYVVSKERNTGKDKTFKVLTKLIKQEQKFRKQVRGSIFTRGTKFEEFKTNMPLIKFFSQAFGEILEKKFGEDYKKKIYKDFLFSASRTSFSELATLKVSSRDHTKEVEVQLGDEKTEDIYKQLLKDFPEELFKRPYCMESITKIIKEYEEDTNQKIVHVVQLAKWCLDELLNKGYFDSDQFDKSQHGGEREIHVLEMKARIVQFYTELVARTISGYFPSETTMNPKTKDRFVKDHYDKARSALGEDYYVISKSADATTWCQFHHSSHFAAMYSSFLPDELKPFVFSALSLWPRKRLSFPMKQASSLAANIKLETSNETYMQFKKEFETGSGMFTKMRTNKIEVISGMFQGILHTTSSLYHTMIQEVMKIVMSEFIIKQMKMTPVITVCQGSDDSACMIALKGKPNRKSLTRVKRLLLWKERVSPYLSVFCNEAKSSIGTHDLVEYNSEWHVRHMIIKPTFRWVSASMELTVTERFVDRMRIFYNMIAECLSGGASTLECAIIQHFQATLHYILMGGAYSREDLRMEYLTRIIDNPEPLYGFFPMDDDVSCGIPGVEFLLYRLFLSTNFGHLQKTLGGSEVEADFSPEDMPSWMKSKDMSSIRLKFSNMKVFYRIVERMNLEPLEEAIKNITDDPYILFSKTNSWTDEQHNLVLKVFSTGVKESVSRKSSLTRMAASSAYILSNKCFVDNNENVMSEDGKTHLHVRHTLLFLMDRDRKKILLKDPSMKKMEIENLFPYHREYKKLAQDIDSLKYNNTLISQATKRTSKVVLQVIEKPVEDIDVIDMCKYAWYGIGRLPFSRGQIKLKWDILRSKFSFLSGKVGNEGLLETASNLKMNVIQTKMFLESMSTRSRKITLYDTSTRAGNLGYSMSRIYWPNKKLLTVSGGLDGISRLRSDIFCLLTYWFAGDRKYKLLEQIIKLNKDLKKDWLDIPSSQHKLKIFHSVLNKEANISILPWIENTKRGTLGTFTQIQQGRGKERRGQGLWQGKICGISVTIHMDDNVCSKIVVQSLHDTVALGMQLNTLMNEASLNMPSSELLENVSSNCWLTSSGKIVLGRDKVGVPIFENENMRFSFDDDLVRMPWYVDIHLQSVRVRARNPRTNEMFTVLSEKFTSRDWVPGCSDGKSDPMFYKWQNGESCSLRTFEQILSEFIPTNRHEFVNFKKQLDSGKIENGYGWDLKALQKTLRMNFLGAKVSRKPEKDDNAIEVSKESLIDFANMMEDFNFGDNDELIMGEITDWAEEMEEDDSLDMEELGGLQEYADIDQAIEMFLGGNETTFYELVNSGDLEKNFKMPSMSRFFAPIEHLTQITTKQDIKTLVFNKTPCEGFLGLLVSFIDGSYLYGKDEDTLNEIIDIEDSISNVSISISNPVMMGQLNLDEVRISIANLEDQYSHVTNNINLKRRLNRLISMYKSREEELMASEELSPDDLIFQNSDKTMKIIRDRLMEDGKFQMDLSSLDEDLRSSVQDTLIRAHVMRSRDITTQEKEEVSIHLASGNLSLASLQTIALAFGYSVNINGQQIMNNLDSSELSVLSFELP